MFEPFGRVIVHEYFYKRFCEIDDEMQSLIRQIRTKSGLVILCDRLRALEMEKVVLVKVYEDLKTLL